MSEGYRMPTKKDLEVSDIWHPTKSRWIKKDGKLTEFGKRYYEEMAKEEEARKRAHDTIRKYDR